MKISIRLLVCSLFTLLIFAGNCPAGEDTATKEVDTIIIEHTQAFDSKSFDKALSFYDENAIIMGTGQGELYIGKEAISNAMKQFFSNFDKEEREVTFRQVKVNGDVAWTISSMTITAIHEGKKSTYDLNLSRVLEKKDGKWLCVAEHFSNLVGDK